MKKKLSFTDMEKLFLASGFGLGLMPIVPGSFGALTGLAWHYFALMLYWEPMDIRIWCLTGAVFFSAVHYLLTPWAQAWWETSDPRHFVLDEIVGYLCTAAMMPEVSVWWQPAFAFCVFRVFDAIKLPLARWIDRNVHTASGVLFDDVVSAAYSAGLCWALHLWLPAFWGWSPMLSFSA